jgi:type II secretory pathway component PulF
MADAAFRYTATDAQGRRSQGVIQAPDEASAFARLRAQDLFPVRLRRDHRAATTAATKPKAPNPRESAEFLSSLADLLRAGADIRTALSILGARTGRPQVDALVARLVQQISGGAPLDRAFAETFRGSQAFVASMVAAGEAAGNLPGGLQRAAEVFQSRLKLRDELVSTLAYPSFVLFSAVAAVFVILLFIVPSIAPLAADAGTAPPTSLAVLMAASDFLKANLLNLGLGLTLLVLGLAVAGRMGLLAAPREALVLDGPCRRTVRGLVYGGFSISLGAMLGAGAPAVDAIRLATRAVSDKAARRRLEPILQAVRQGRPLSAALQDVRGFPPTIIRLATVGESTNAIGAMLIRGGELEETGAMRRIEAFGRLAGPALIVFLGLLLGVLMGGLLSGVSQMGAAALN